MNGNTMKKKLMSLLLVAAMVLTTLGVTTLGNTAYAAENEISITVTVSNAGELAKDAAGNEAANLPVTVPADANGTATVDAALKALHEAYCPGGYVTSESAYGLAVQKLWGVENGGSYLFAINGVGCSSGVGYDLIGEGQHLTAVVMKDMTYWSDLIASFDKAAATAKVGEEVELALTYDAVTYDENWNAAHAATPVAGANVSIGGEIVATTDDAGKASVSFDEAGTYVVTASGAVKMQVQDWSQGGAYVEADAPISAPACVITVEEEETPVIDEEDDAVIEDEEEQDVEEEPVVEEKPVTEEEPVEEAEEEETEKAPATGDASQMAVYLIMMMAAAGAMVATKKQK